MYYKDCTCCYIKNKLTNYLNLNNTVVLQDDFYLNLVDWSGQNILSVGLGTCVYLWSACTSQVQLVHVIRNYDPCTIRF